MDNQVPDNSKTLKTNQSIVQNQKAEPADQKHRASPFPAPTVKDISITKHKVFIIGGLLLSIVVVLISVTVASKRTSFPSRAETKDLSFTLSSENSYMIASPLSARADGVSTIRITVFVLSTQGLGIEGQRVEITEGKDFSTNSIQPTTDAFGRAIFDVISTNPGNYKLTAQVGDVTLPQSVSVSFH